MYPAAKPMINPRHGAQAGETNTANPRINNNEIAPKIKPDLTIVYLLH
jgi:hypothetical protein